MGRYIVLRITRHVSMHMLNSHASAVMCKMTENVGHQVLRQAEGCTVTASSISLGAISSYSGCTRYANIHNVCNWIINASQLSLP